MARYATAAQVRDELCADPAHPDGTAAELGDTKLEDCADAASSEVDAALGTAGYRIADLAEGASFPRLIREVTAALAAQDADLAYREGKPQPADHPIRKRWEWAQALLEAWAKGERIPLGVPAPAGGESSDLQIGAGVNTVPCVFDDELLRPAILPASDAFYDPDWWRRLSS